MREMARTPTAEVLDTLLAINSAYNRAKVGIPPGQIALN